MEEKELPLEHQYLLRISEDKMGAFFIRNSLARGFLESREYFPEKEKEAIVKFLEDNKVVYGIKETAIDWLAENPGFYDEVLVAAGNMPKTGKDGFYEYAFDTNRDKKPIILEDGSVDYNTLGRMELCGEGDLLATYYPAVPGEEGRDVHGNPVAAKKALELKAIKGKGFRCSPSGLEYFAAYEGRVELVNGNLQVSRMYTVEGDLDAVTGGIKFTGDVLVKGNVYSDVTIEATGNITVNGHVEVAKLKAGGEVLLRGGMQGAGRGQVNAEGDVSANFFEQTQIVAGGRVNANVILNCDIESNIEVVVSGKRGAIIGGITTAVEKITAMSIGNKAEAMTRVNVGVNMNFQSILTGIEEIIERNKQKLDEISREIRIFSGKSDKPGSTVIQNKKTELMREKIRHESMVNEQQKKLNKLLDMRERSLEAEILVRGRLYPRVKVAINGVLLLINGECNNVTLKKRTGEIHIYSNTLFG